MDNDHPAGEVRPIIVRDVLDTTGTQGASVGMRFRAASATGFGHRSLANRFKTADPPTSGAGKWESIGSDQNNVELREAHPWWSMEHV
jgi:hypothetical protein